MHHEFLGINRFICKKRKNGIYQEKISKTYERRVCP